MFKEPQDWGGSIHIIPASQAATQESLVLDKGDKGEDDEQSIVVLSVRGKGRPDSTARGLQAVVPG